MRKPLVIIASAALALCLAGCGGVSTSATTENDSATIASESTSAAPECVHQWQVANCTYPKHCTECGLQEGDIDPSRHGWNDAICTKPKNCGYCGATEGERNPLNHNWSDTADQGYMICEWCGEVSGEIPSK